MEIHKHKKKIFTGQYTAITEKSFVIFFIGIRVNNLWAVHKWLPFVVRLFALKVHLKNQYQASLLNTNTWFSWREIMLVQYWDSLENLEAFSRSEIEPHIRIWRKYNQSIGKSAHLGVWHETYLIKKEDYECVYNNMPRVGLSAAKKHSKMGY